MEAKKGEQEPLLKPEPQDFSKVDVGEGVGEVSDTEHVMLYDMLYASELAFTRGTSPARHTTSGSHLVKAWIRICLTHLVFCVVACIIFVQMFLQKACVV